MHNAFPDWLFNVLFLGGIAGILVLGFNAFVPILGTLTTLIALALVLLISAFWPKW